MFSKRLDKRLVSLTAPGSIEAEQYQALRLKIEARHRSDGVRLIAITSPGIKDGKTVTTINLAAALARGSDARVLLIEADLRRPAVARYLGAGHRTAGLADLVLDPTRTLSDVVVQTASPAFGVVFAGSSSGPVHDVFRSPRFEEILFQARDAYDYVILDTPPLGPVSDCALLARWVDGVLVVVSAHRTSRKLLESALSLLDGSQVLGMVFNGDDRPRFGKYRRHYYQDHFPQASRAFSESLSQR
jgi:capsular exopolysaccharide synthesis family protein